MSSISVLLAPMTSAQIWASILSIAETIELDVTSWKELDPSRTLLHLSGDLFAERQAIELEAIKGGFLDDAEGIWLDLLVGENYCDADGSPIVRIPATFTSGEVTLTNAGGGSYAYAAGEVTFQNSATGKTYRNTEAIALGPLGTQDVDILADEAGSGSSSGATDIDTIVDSAMIGVTCSNASALVGVDAESDDDLKERARDSLGALSPNGPKAAYEFVCKSATRPDGSAVAINRVRAWSTAGTVSVVVASPTGAPTVADVGYCEDAVQAQCVPLGVPCNAVTGATEVAVPITATVYIPDDTADTDGEIEAAIEAALVAYGITYPIGGRTTVPGGAGFLFASLLRGKVSSANAAIFSVTLTLPAADVPLADNEVAVFGAPTLTITRVAQ